MRAATREPRVRASPAPDRPGGYSLYARVVPGVVIIPVKSFSMGKRRLAGAVDPGTRARLGRGLAEHVASTVASAGQMPLVVTADPEVADWAMRSGFPSLPDPGNGLDLAAHTGVDWARHSGGFWLVVHSDLPLLDPADISALTRPLDNRRDVIAPSSDGGTSAIGSWGAVDFAFGIASFHHHLHALDNPQVIARPGLLLDVDAPVDLNAASRTNRGRWLREILA